MEEEWRDISGYEGLYQVSNFGRVKRLPAKLQAKDGKYYFRNGIILKQYTMKNKGRGNYLVVHLSKSNNRRAKIVHRLVAEAFIPNPKNKSQVNHKDGNKANNKINNLEWVTQSENMLHSMNILGGKGGFGRIPIRCVETNVEYCSIMEATRQTNVQQSSISKALLGKVHTAGGYHWEYI